MSGVVDGSPSLWSSIFDKMTVEEQDHYNMFLFYMNLEFKSKKILVMAQEWLKSEGSTDDDESA